jgi:hypothetical protein
MYSFKSVYGPIFSASSADLKTFVHAECLARFYFVVVAW